MGSERVPEGPIMTPKTLLGPFGPILAYFLGGGQAGNFSKSFWAKKGQKFFFKKKFWFALFWLAKGLGPSKPQNWPCRPPQWTHFGSISEQKGRFWGQKKTCFSQKILFCSKSFFIGSQMVWDPQKPKIGPLYPPMEPIWACSGSSGRHATRLVSHI